MPSTFARRWGAVALGREPFGGIVVFFGASTGRLAPLRYKVDGIVPASANIELHEMKQAGLPLGGPIAKVRSVPR